MEKVKSNLYILLILLILPVVLLTGCNNEAQIKRNLLQNTGDEVVSNNVVINWYIDGNTTPLQADENSEFEYTKVYSGNAVNIVCKYSLNNGVEVDIESSKIIINNNITEIKYVGEYDVSVDESVFDEFENCSIKGKDLKIIIKKAELTAIWDLPNDKLDLGNDTYKLKYTGEDYADAITVKTEGDLNATNKAKYTINNNLNIAEIENVGTYTLSVTGYDTGNYTSDYEITNKTVTIIIEQEKEVVWNMPDDIDKLSDTEYLVTYSAQDYLTLISVDNIFMNVDADKLLLSVSRNNKQVNTVTDVGIYTYTVTSNSYFLTKNSIDLEITKKTIFVVANSFNKYYGDQLPKTSELGYTIYSTYDSTNIANNVKFDNANIGVDISVNYKNTTYAEIVADVDNWKYDKSLNNIKKDYDIEVMSNDTSLNYNIDYRDGKLTINLKQIEISFSIDSTDILHKKVYYQTETIPYSVFEQIKSGINTDRELTNWCYKESANSNYQDIESDYFVTSEKTFHIFSIYYINYFDEDNTTLIARVPYSKKASVEYPKKSHVTSGEYSVNNINTLPKRVAYEHNGWSASVGGADITPTKTNIDNNIADINLYPTFKAKDYWIILHEIVFDESGSEPIIDDTKKIKFTIVDFYNEKTLDIPQVPGYQFDGWYYNGIKVQNNKFRVSDYLTEDKLDEYDDNIEFVTKFVLYKSIVTIMVGDKTIATISMNLGDRINKDYLYSLVERKFGFIYYMIDVSDTVKNTVEVVRIYEFPLLYVVAGLLILGIIIFIIVRKVVIKRHNDIEKNKLDIILNRLDDR